MSFYCLSPCPSPHPVASTQCKFQSPVTPQSTCVADVLVRLSECLRTPSDPLGKEWSSFRSVS